MFQNKRIFAFVVLLIFCLPSIFCASSNKDKNLSSKNYIKKSQVEEIDGRKYEVCEFVIPWPSFYKIACSSLGFSNFETELKGGKIHYRELSEYALCIANVFSVMDGLDTVYKVDFENPVCKEVLMSKEYADDMLSGGWRVVLDKYRRPTLYDVEYKLSDNSMVKFSIKLCRYLDGKISEQDFAKLVESKSVYKNGKFVKNDNRSYYIPAHIETVLTNTEVSMLRSYAKSKGYKPISMFNDSSVAYYNIKGVAIYCNALSELTGREICYKTEKTETYKGLDDNYWFKGDVYKTNGYIFILEPKEVNGSEIYTFVAWEE